MKPKMKKIHTDEYFEQKLNDFAPGWTEHLDYDEILHKLNNARKMGRCSRAGEKDRFILPTGMRAACHLHPKTLYFKSIEECERHTDDYHRIFKG